MLITFKCRAKETPDLVMLAQHVKPIFDLLDKDPVMGVITAAETAHAIQLLQGEIAKTPNTKAAGVEHDVLAHHGENGDDPGHEVIEPVSYSARMLPLLKMLIAANKAKEDILWGV